MPRTVLSTDDICEILVRRVDQPDRLFAQTFAQLPHNRPGETAVGPKFELFAEGEKNFFAKVADD